MARVDPERWLSLLTEVVHRNTISGLPIVLNTMQCQHLAQTCLSMLRETNMPSHCDRLLHELHGTLEEILVYFEACSEEYWLGFLATHLDTQEAYLLHLRDFMFCMATSYSLAQHLSRGSPFVDVFTQRMAEYDQALSNIQLENHVRTDRHAMVDLLRAAQKEHGWYEKHGRANQVSKKSCLPFSFRRRKFPANPQPPLPNSCRLAAFLARKCDVMVSLAVTPHNAPKDFCIDSHEIGLVDSIGEGGFGQVYKGKWLDQTVAVKEFRTKDPSFINEASMLAGLSNPYIIQLIGWSRDEAKGTFSLVMELMDEDLAAYMANHSPSLEVVVDIMLQLSRGMEYLHARKVIHRDLKPSNVLVSSCVHKADYLRIKLCDFGIAKFKPETPFYSTEKQGTLYYRAPEVLGYADSNDNEEGNVLLKKYTLKADVFSFAILCYEILEQGAPKCFLCHPEEFYNRVTRNVRPELSPSCPLLLSECIKRCWHSDPSHRPSFAEISKVLVYMKSALIGLKSPTVAGSSAMLSDFVKEEAPSMGLQNR